mmetsp:Transcript_66893/g.122146  ORF Transcript_66893/g.122146 Transcript_66893/m.122146 type:complete len:586 (-) Transcript_66893:76-1833(-)
MAGFDFDELEKFDELLLPRPAAPINSQEVPKVTPAESDTRISVFGQYLDFNKDFLQAGFSFGGVPGGVQQQPRTGFGKEGKDGKDTDAKKPAASALSTPPCPQEEEEEEQDQSAVTPVWMKKLMQKLQDEFSRDGGNLAYAITRYCLIDWPDDGEGLWSDRQAAWWGLRMLAAGLGSQFGNHIPHMSLEPCMFRLYDPENPVRYGLMFGKHRTPTIFLVAPPVEGLASYLRLDPNGPFAGGPLDWIYARDSPWWQKWKFAEDGEQVTKADWHAVPSSSEEAERFVPRLGKAVAMPRAPPRIEAFAESFRASNRVVWSAIHDSIIALVHKRSQDNPVFAKGDGRLLTELANSLLIHGHFGVVEAQLRWGDGELTLPSHVDGITSLLHLGVTLGGRRTLRSATFPAHNTASRVERNVWNEGLWNKDHLGNVLMTKGSIYLSSPYCFEHGVRYHTSGMNDPVIALQFRFALDGELGLKINTMRDDIMREVTTIIAGVLKTAGETGTLRLPSIQDVQASEKRLRDAAHLRNGVRRQAKARAEAKAQTSVQPKAKAPAQAPPVGFRDPKLQVAQYRDAKLGNPPHAMGLL